MASRALSELKGAITNLPNPALFIDTINLQEAQASSAIENIVTTQDELFKSYLAEKTIDNPVVKEVLHYKEALWMAWDQLDKSPLLTTNLFLRIVQVIKKILRESEMYQALRSGTRQPEKPSIPLLKESR